MRLLSLLITLLCILPALAEEVYRWEDENGKIHYGDRVPDKYLATAEKVKSDISVVSPETDVQNQNSAYAKKLDYERKKEEKRLARERKLQQKQAAAQAKKSSTQLTKEQCRDKYSSPSMTRERTECFRKVAEQNQP